MGNLALARFRHKIADRAIEKIQHLLTQGDIVRWDISTLITKKSSQVVRLLPQTPRNLYVEWLDIPRRGNDVPNMTEDSRAIVELRSLGIDPKGATEFNDKKELEELAEILKQSMIEDYKMAYSDKGRQYREEANSTLTPQ